ncbi:Vacuolar protein-sorting-associated protein 33 [Dipsacomyces acuminosporus]|nr:Vacuolar protein-sorting-associated protein 33 [Dipsacomyces acuminosporus]
MPRSSEEASSASKEEPNLLQLKDLLRDDLIAILDTIRGSKALVLDEDLSGAFSYIVDFSVLKEHGVEKIHLLDSTAPAVGTVKGVIYFTLPHITKMRLISEQIRNSKEPVEYSLQLVPKRTLLCERILEEEGVLGDLTLGEYKMDFIPLENDLLSLELPNTFKELYLDGDFASIQYTANALMRFQAQFGYLPRIVGKGDFAQILAENLNRMRLEIAITNPRASLSNELNLSSTFDSLVIIDRGIDLVTPLLTQLTYEGLISEVFGINNGSVTLASSSAAAASTAGGGGGDGSNSANKKRRIALNNTDKIFSDIRNMNFAGVGGLLSRMSRQLQDTYESRHKAKTVQEIRSFVGKLSGLQAEHQSLKTHVSLAEVILKRTQTDEFNSILEIEQALVGAGDLNKDQLAFIDKLFALADTRALVPQVSGQLRDELPSAIAPHSIHKALRIICLYALWRGPSFKQKVYDAWYEEVIAAFGHHHAITLDNLAKVGLFPSPSYSSAAAGSSARMAAKSLDSIQQQQQQQQHGASGLLNSIVPSTRPRDPAHTNSLSFLRKTLNLIVSDVRENDPDDVSYVYSGYAPISVRLLQCLVRDPAVYSTSAISSRLSSINRYTSLLRSSTSTTADSSSSLYEGNPLVGGVKSGWKGWDDVLNELPGYTVDMKQAIKGEDVVINEDDLSVKRRLGEKPPCTLVLFLGGCTYTEIAAVRLLSQMHNHKYIVATTEIINGNSFLDPLIQKASK